MIKVKIVAQMGYGQKVSGQKVLCLLVLKIVYINHAQIQKLVLVKINQILVMITVVIIKEALCFCKSEPFLSDDDSITENEDININNMINGSYVSNKHSRLPPLRPGFGSWHGLKWEKLVVVCHWLAVYSTEP